jgi:YidC/Oxa1 family membrane protein insertase
MERRVLLAIVLAFVVLYAWQALFVPPPPANPPTESNQSAASGTAAPAAPASGPPGAVAPAGDTPPAAPASSVLLGETSERDVRVETETVVAVFTNRGGRLKSWRLKQYLDQQRQPLELVDPQLAATHPLPFSLRVADDAPLTEKLNGALYSVGGASGAGTTPHGVTFEYRDSSGVRALKQFQLEPASFVVSFRSQVVHGDRPVNTAIEWGPALASTGAGSSYSQAAQGILFIDGDVERLAPDDIAEQPTYQGSYRFAGVDDHYFTSLTLDPGPATFTFQPVAVPPPAGSADPVRNLMAYSVEGGSGDAPMRFFVGPKDFDQLAAVDRTLTETINYGIFDVIVVPLLRTLKWINGYVGNYGWSIVILTILINAMMFPLRHKSVVSMRKMQQIQPEAKAIQERYAKLKATDPAKQKMNQELMALYRERGVNPASGCVPMLLTMPVLFALFSLLSVSIELRGAPFVAWIRDLSLPDPYFVTPVLMGASQLWQQWMTPQVGVDPAQQKMMMVMPVVFTVFSLWFPAGVALYWLVSNVWGIGQTYLTNYLIGPPNVRPPSRPAAERRMKKVGSGKTDAAAREE